MLIPRFCAWIFSTVMMFLGAGAVSGQDFPNKPVRLVAGGAGGSGDAFARFMAQGLSGPLGQQVVVVNYPSGNAPALAVAKAPPDGYTLLVGGVIFWLGPLLQKDPPYDVVRDFAAVSLASAEPTILVVHPSLPVKSVKELIALAKARPGELNYSSGVTGSFGHLAAESFKYMADVKIQGVPYSSGSMRVAALLSGEVQIEFSTPRTVAAHVKSGRLRAVAVGGLQRSPLVPDLPTIAESGVPGYESTGKTGLFVPVKTSEAIIKRLNQEIVRFLNQPDVKKKFLDNGEEAIGSSPEQLAAMVASEREQLDKVIKAAGIKGQ